MRIPQYSTGKMYARGFSLLEILVVVIILSILVGTIGIKYFRNDAEQLDRTARQLRSQLVAVRDTAILQGRPYSILFSDDTYSILTLNREQRLVAVRDDVFAQSTRLPPGYAFGSIDIPGFSSDSTKGLLIDSTGMLPVFRISINKGQHRVDLAYSPEKGFTIVPGA